MKRLIFIALAVCLSTHSFSQEISLSNMRLGGGLFFASEIGNIGLSLTGNYEITEQWEAAITYTHIFEKDYVKWNILDFDGHYVFYSPDDKLNIYALAGLSFTFLKAHIPAYYYNGFLISAENTVTDSQVGLNVGVGTNYKLSDKLNLAPEFRITILDGSYLRIGATLQYVF